MTDLNEILKKIKPTVLGWFTTAGGGSGPYAPTPHDLNGSHHAGNISDAQHGSRTVANAHAHSNLSGIGANDHHAQQHAISGSDHTGTLGAGQLPATAIVEADAGTATPQSVDTTGATAGTGRKYARENHRHIINEAINAVWTGLHTFRGLLTTRHVEPETGEMYDIGSVQKRYRTLRVAELAATLFSKEEIMILGNELIIAKDASILPLDMTSGQVTYNFGRLMTPGDFMQIAAEDTAGNPSVEWIQIASLVSGTTYNITRNVDGSGANNWATGTPFIIIGQGGDFRINLKSGANPFISFLQQGSAWNFATSVSKIDKSGVRLAQGGFGVETVGFRIDKGSTGFRATIGSAVGVDHASLLSQGEAGSTSASIGMTAFHPTLNGNPTITLENHIVNGPSAKLDVGVLKLPVTHADPLGPMLSVPQKRYVSAPDYGYIGNVGTAMIVDMSGQDRHLTAFGTVFFGATQHGTAMQVGNVSIPAGANYLERADEFGLGLGMINAFTVMAWVQFADINAVGVNQFLMGQGDIGATTAQWYIWAWGGSTPGSRALTFSVHNATGGAMFSQDFSSVAGLANSQWYFVAARYSASTEVATFIKHPGVAGLSKTFTTSSVPAALNNSASPFRIFRSATGSDALRGGVLGAHGLYAYAANDYTIHSVFESQRAYYGV